MIKRVLIAVAVLAASPSLLSAQDDVFFAFGSGANVSADIVQDINVDSSGSAFIYVRNGFNFVFFDFEFTSSDTSVVTLTNAILFNDPFLLNNYPTQRWDDNFIANVSSSGGSGNLLAVAVLSKGIDSNFASNDTNFDAAADLFTLAQIDYDIVGTGTAELSVFLTPDGSGVIDTTPDVRLYPVFGSATITVVPEPGTAGVLALGLGGLLARRRRA